MAKMSRGGEPLLFLPGPPNFSFYLDYQTSLSPWTTTRDVASFYIYIYILSNNTRDNIDFRCFVRCFSSSSSITNWPLVRLLIRYLATPLSRFYPFGASLSDACMCSICMNVCMYACMYVRMYVCM